MAFQTLPGRQFFEVSRSGLAGIFQVRLKHCFDFVREISIRECGSDFEIEPEGSIVEIDRAYHGETVINKHDLLVHEPFIVEVSPCAHIGQIFQIHVGRVAHEPVVVQPGVRIRTSNPFSKARRNATIVASSGIK